MRKFDTAAASFCVLLAAACASAAPEPATAPAPVATPPRTMAWLIDSVADAPPLNRTTWGIQVLDQETGRVLYERNGERHYIPASNTKLVVTLVAMGMLGPDYRHQTPIIAGEQIANGVVKAVMIRGSGDPTFSQRYYGTRLGAARAFADSIAARGVRRIDGPLIIDASLFTDPMINGTWEVGDLPGTAAPPVAAFAFDESIFRVSYVPGLTPNAPISLMWHDWPGRTGGQPISISRVRTDTAKARTRISSDYLARRDTIYLSGSIPLDYNDTTSHAMTDPPLYAGRAIAAALEAKGVRVNGGVFVARDSTIAAAALRAMGITTTLATMVSPPMSEIVSVILHPSQNWVAEMVLKTLGATRGTTGSWAGGLSVEWDYLVKNVGLDSLDFNLRDASGMAPQNLLSPHAINQMLEHARRSTWGTQYRAALAAPGEYGTLENRLTEYKGRLQGKTGTISNVATLSGYLTADSGRQVTFAIMTNGTGLSSATVRRHVDEIVRIIARSN